MKGRCGGIPGCSALRVACSLSLGGMQYIDIGCDLPSLLLVARTWVNLHVILK